MIVKAPFTPEQVANLWQYQNGEGGWRASPMHPFTCENHGREDHVHLGVPDYLVPTKAGMICPFCDYTQDWVHHFMAEKRVMYETLGKMYGGSQEPVEEGNKT